MNARIDRETNAIREAATEWVVSLSSEEVTAQERADFTAWLRRSPSHVTEYLHAEAAWQAMEGAAEDDKTAIQEVIGHRRPDVVEFPGGDPLTKGAVPHRARRRVIAWSVAATVLLAAGIAFSLWISERLDPNSYSTRIGEIQRVQLTDGSTVEMNTQSKIRVQMSATAREVIIERGEAFFKVARDPARPFRVYSDSAVIRALGTEFNVYRQPMQTIVTVIEGSVAVTGPESGGIKSLLASELIAGDRVVVPSRKAKVENMNQANVDPQRAIAWRERRLIFDNEPLSAVAEEFNRYNRRQLVVENPELGAQRISGVFKADRPDALVDFLTKTGNIRAVDVSGSRTLLSVEP